jgi:predicted O-methyltransferase YrrM
VRYTSNLVAPDLRPFFKLADPMIQKMGHDIPSDPDFDPNCGFLSDDEAAILYAVARAWPKRWVDIGARFGWSTAHIARALDDGDGLEVTAVDQEYSANSTQSAFSDRALENYCAATRECFLSYCGTSEAYFSTPREIDAAMIDGNHDEPEPTLDALRAIDAGASVLVFHDFAGRPIRDAVNALLHGQRYPGDVRDGIVNLWRARVYWTPNAMAVAWRDGCGFVPPEHVRDPRADWSGMERIVAEDFDVRRCV